MKKTLIAALMGSACLLSGQAMATTVDGSLTPFTASTTVQAEGITLTVDQTPATVSAEEAAKADTVLLELTVTASGLNPDGNGTNRIDVGAATADGWDSDNNRWIFKNTNGDALYAKGVAGDGWNSAMGQASDTLYGLMRYVADGETDLTTSSLQIVTATSSSSVAAGEYTLNMAVANNTW